MPKFELLLSIIVEAADENAAFTAVRSNYCVVNDPNNIVKDNIVDFLIDDRIHEYDDDDDEVDV